MRRRDFIKGMTRSAFAWPLAARAQHPATPVIGLLGTRLTDEYVDRQGAFHQGLKDTGYVEGQNVAIDYRWAESQSDRLPALAAELVRRQVDVIVTSGGPPAALAAKTATRTIPIVFSLGVDPVEAGFVASLNRPGGNLTGVALLIGAVVAKRAELLHELVPAATLIALLTNPANPLLIETETRELQAAARVLGVRLLVLNATSPTEIEAAFASLVEQRAGGLLVSTDPSFTSRLDQIVALAARYTVPAIYGWRDYTAVGGLMSYGPNRSDFFRLQGVYAGRILKGEKPADLPVQQVTKIELIVNLKTAKALGLTIPLPLLGRADEVIE
jgi:putative tryptophan/tyrosine transport system substrate-binding protein